MNVIDSCGWLEYFADGKNAYFFEKSLEHTADIIVPTLCIYEVYKAIISQRNEDAAVQAVALMQQGCVVPLTTSISLHAAKLSSIHKLPLADSIIYATAEAYDAVIWTQDAHFKTLPHVKYIKKQK